MQQIASKSSAPSAKAGVAVCQVPFDAPWAWLAAGWRDLWAAPQVSLTYGAVFAIVSAALAVGLMVGGLESLILALGGGFLLIGPVAAVGLYETSRRLERGERVRFGDICESARAGTRPARLLRRHPGVRLFRLAAAGVPAVHAVPRQQAVCRRRASSCRRCCSRRTGSACWSPAPSSAACWPALVFAISVDLGAAADGATHRCRHRDPASLAAVALQPQADGAVGGPDCRLHGARDWPRCSSGWSSCFR